MLQPHTLKNLNCFVDGRGYAGAIASIELPPLSLKTEDYRGGGLDTDIELDVGMEKLVAKLKFNRKDAELYRGFGLSSADRINYTVRGAIDEDGAIKPVVIKLSGGTKMIEGGPLEPGKVVETTLEVSLRYFEMSIDGVRVCRIDVDNMVREINGVDQLAAARAAIGV